MAGAAVYTRKRIPGAGVPDMLLCNGVSAIVIENKIKAGEGANQRARYSSPAAQTSTRNLLGLSPEAEISFFYLTLFPPETPEADPKHHFEQVDYRRLKGLFAEAFPDLDVGVRRLLIDLSALLSRFYERGDVGPDAVVKEILRRDGDPLDGSFLAFRSIMADVRLPPGVEYRGSWMANRSGNPTFACQYYRDGWQPNPRAATLADLEPRQHFSAHVEPTYLVLRTRLKIKVHFETYPYATRRVLLSKLSSKQIDEFDALFAGFRDRIVASRLQTLPGFADRRGSLQACRFDVPIIETSVADLQAHLSHLFACITPEIDGALRDLDLG